MKRLLATWVVLALAAPASAQLTGARTATTYHLTIGGKAIPNGAVWLYYYGYGYLQYSLMSGIKNGEAHIRVTPELVDADSRDSTFIVAVETPSGWYRSADFGDLNSATAALESLGKTASKSSHAVDLPAPVRQNVRVLNPDGTPRSGVRLLLSTYVSQDNHCARHMGFYGDTIELRSDRNGLAAFDAPLADLVLRNEFYVERQVGSIRLLSRGESVRLPAGREHLVQGAWERAAPREFQIHVAFTDGTPVTSAVLLESEDTETCDYSNNEFKADSNGIIRAKFALEHASGLCFVPADGFVPPEDETSCLSAPEREELHRTGKLDVTWPRE